MRVHQFEIGAYYYETLREAGTGVEVSADAECVDIFRSFGYMDFSKYERTQNAYTNVYTEEDIEADEREYLQERYCCSLCQNLRCLYRFGTRSLYRYLAAIRA